jgi:peptidoglycan hydrolase FlgJ
MANLPVSLPQGVMALRSAAAPTSDAHAKARANAVDFEAMFLSSMFNNMFTGIDGEGPFGGNGAGGVWRSFLSDEYAKSFAKAGGIGLADSVYRSLIAQQEARGAEPRAPRS